MMKLIPCFLATALLIAPLSARPNKQTKTIGYLPSYRVNTTTLATLNNYTDIVYFGAEINADGTVLLRKQDHTNLTKISNTKGTFKLHFCLGGWEKDKHFPAVTANPQKRKKLIEELIKLQRKYKFQGIDYDWEYPRNHEELENFALLIQETQKAFPAAFEVTAALNAHHEAPKSMWENLDRVHLMTYDNRGEHCSIAHAKSAIQTWKKRGVPASKLTIGAAFYGRHINNRNKVLSYAELISKYGTQAATNNKLGGYFYDNLTTLKHKLTLVEKEQLSGMIIWEIGQDSTGAHSLGAFLKRENTKQ